MRYITLALLAFSVIYLPHGLLTPWAQDNIWLFLLYGPASRFIMAGYLFLALCSYTEAEATPDNRRDLKLWRGHFLLIAAVLPVVAVLAYSPFAGALWLRLIMEGGAVALCCGALVAMATREIRSPLMGYTRVALIFFAESSAVFLLAKPWNHMWWLAHIIFAAGFFILSFGVVQAYRSTRSFASVYSHEELIARLAAAQAREDALRQSEDRLRDILNASPMAVAVTTLGGTILFRNEPLDQLFSRASSELAALVQHALNVGLENGGRSIDMRFRHGDGELGWARVVASVISYQGEAAAVIHIQDISGQKSAHV